MIFFKVTLRNILKDVPGLIKALNDPKPHVREAAADALVSIGVPAIESLIGGLWNYRIRKEASDALVKIGQPAVELLIAALKSDNAHVCEAAAGALGKIGDVRAVVPLVTTLKDSDGGVHKAAADALGKIGDVRSVMPLAITLKNDKLYDRTSAWLALRQIGQPAVELLVAALKDRDIREVAANALDILGWQRSYDEASAIYWIIRWEFEKCIKIGLPAVEPLITELQDENASFDKLMTCYRILSQILDGNTSNVDIQNLSASSAKRIRNLYSRTRVVAGGYWENQWGSLPADPDDYRSGDSSVFIQTESEESDPDIEGIRNLIALMPEELRDRVRALVSDEVKPLFSEYRSAIN